MDRHDFPDDWTVDELEAGARNPALTQAARDRAAEELRGRALLEDNPPERHAARETLKRLALEPAAAAGLEAGAELDSRRKSGAEVLAEAEQANIATNRDTVAAALRARAERRGESPDDAERLATEGKPLGELRARTQVLARLERLDQVDEHVRELRALVADVDDVGLMFEGDRIALLGDLVRRIEAIPVPLEQEGR